MSHLFAAHVVAQVCESDVVPLVAALDALLSDRCPSHALRHEHHERRPGPTAVLVPKLLCKTILTDTALIPSPAFLHRTAGTVIYVSFMSVLIICTMLTFVVPSYERGVLLTVNAVLGPILSLWSCTKLRRSLVWRLITSFDFCMIQCNFSLTMACYACAAIYAGSGTALSICAVLGFNLASVVFFTNDATRLSQRQKLLLSGVLLMASSCFIVAVRFSSYICNTEISEALEVTIDFGIVTTTLRTLIISFMFPIVGHFGRNVYGMVVTKNLFGVLRFPAAEVVLTEGELEACKVLQPARRLFAAHVVAQVCESDVVPLVAALDALLSDRCPSHALRHEHHERRPGPTAVLVPKLLCKTILTDTALIPSPAVLHRTAGRVIYVSFMSVLIICTMLTFVVPSYERGVLLTVNAVLGPILSLWSCTKLRLSLVWHLITCFGFCMIQCHFSLTMACYACAAIYAGSGTALSICAVLGFNLASVVFFTNDATRLSQRQKLLLSGVLLMASSCFIVAVRFSSYICNTEISEALEVTIDFGIVTTSLRTLITSFMVPIVVQFGRNVYGMVVANNSFGVLRFPAAEVVLTEGDLIDGVSVPSSPSHKPSEAHVVEVFDLAEIVPSRALSPPCTTAPSTPLS